MLLILPKIAECSHKKSLHKKTLTEAFNYCLLTDAGQG